MRIFYKKRGETPFQALERMRVEQPDLQDETLSYAGRLDPMAEGTLPVLVGREENQKRQEYLGKDKEYLAEFMIGCATDTGDVLGLITESNFGAVAENEIKKAVEELVSIKKQTYPWYSSKTVDGIPLFEYARKGQLDVVRPERAVTVYEVKDIEVHEVDGQELREMIISDIETVVGDFRQEEIVKSWGGVDIPSRVQLFSFACTVSSGTYIRAFCEYFSERLGAPVLLSRLVRTKVL